MSGFGGGFETRSWSFMKFRWIARSVARCYLRLLLVISSAVEESLTSQGRVAPIFTHRLRLEYHDRTWSRRQIVRDPSTSLRSGQDDKRENSASSVMLCSADDPAESTRHARSNARRLIFRTAHAHVLSSRAQARVLTHGR